MNLPNWITLSRFVAVPLTMWLIVDGYLLGAFWVFVAAGVSDALDGFIAKTFDMETELGKYLDPLADKALLVSVYVTLGVEGYMASWLVILVVFRDIAIVGGALLFETMTHSLSMHPLMVSKVNTVVQIILATAILANAGYGVELHGSLDMLIFLTAATTVLSGLAYAVQWVKSWTQVEDKK